MNYYDYKIFAMIVQMLEIIMTKKFFPVSTSTDAAAATFGSRSSWLTNDDEVEDIIDLSITGYEYTKNDVSQ